MHVENAQERREPNAVNLKLPPREGNKTERAFGEHLHVYLIDGKILWYAFEPMRLKLGRGAWYTPDFAVLEDSGQFVCYEVKGFFREAAKVRIKVAKSLYPFLKFIVVRRQKGEWTYEEVQ